MGRESNKKRRATVAATAREKAAAARADQHRAEQRRRAVVILSTVLTLAVVGVIIAVIAINSTSKSGPAKVASASVLSQVMSVPASVSSQIAGGTTLAAGVPETIQGTSLQSAGKPTLLYIGAEFCPLCAAQRWAVVQSLSKFGTFSGLQQIKSSEDSISTFTFLHAKYTSKYLNFDAKEEADQNHNTLEPLTSTEKTQWNKYLGPGESGPGYPFLDFNGQYVSVEPMVDPTVLLGKTWAQIASSLATPSSPIAKAVDGAANYITATICKQTGDKPASACPASIQALTQHYQPYKA
jgi:Domain of unknown function (DUF929)